MGSQTPLTAVERLMDATNRHDLEGLVACFADDYSLTAPAHPQRAFQGCEQVRRNWTQIFGAVPDLAARTVRTAVEGGTVWVEMEMSGTRRDGVPHLMRGVFIFGVDGDRIGWGRMFLEPVEEGGGDINAAVRNQVAPKP